MRKHIKYRARYDPANPENVYITITEQTHVGKEFGTSHRYGQSCYISAGEEILVSHSYPDWYEDSPRVFFVRGSDDYQEDRTFTLPLGLYQKFKGAVLEYNEVHAN